MLNFLFYGENYERKEKILLRDINRLDSFYDELKEIHKKSFPDMRYGQFMMNALGFINSTKKRDPFFPEEDEMLNLIKEYANTNSMWYQGWELLKNNHSDKTMLAHR